MSFICNWNYISFSEYREKQQEWNEQSVILSLTQDFSHGEHSPFFFLGTYLFTISQFLSPESNLLVRDEDESDDDDEGGFEESTPAQDTNECGQN